MVRSCLDLFFFSSRRRHTRLTCDWSSDVCSSDLENRTKPKISRKSMFRGSIAATCDGAVTKVPGRFLQNDVVPHVARGGKHQRLLNFRSSPQKDFCNNIDPKQTSEETRLAPPFVLRRHVTKC